MIGLNDAEGDGEPAAVSSVPFAEQHDVSTPLMTPPESVTPTVRTLLRSLSDEQPAIHTAAQPPPSLPATQLPPANIEPVVKTVDAATECAL